MMKYFTSEYKLKNKNLIELQKATQKQQETIAQSMNELRIEVNIKLERKLGEIK